MNQDIKKNIDDLINDSLVIPLSFPLNNLTENGYRNVSVEMNDSNYLDGSYEINEFKEEIVDQLKFIDADKEVFVIEYIIKRIKESTTKIFLVKFRDDIHEIEIRKNYDGLDNRLKYISRWLNLYVDLLKYLDQLKQRSRHIKNLVSETGQTSKILEEKEKHQTTLLLKDLFLDSKYLEIIINKILDRSPELIRHDRTTGHFIWNSSKKSELAALAVVLQENCRLNDKLISSNQTLRESFCQYFHINISSRTFQPSSILPHKKGLFNFIRDFD